MTFHLSNNILSLRLSDVREGLESQRDNAKTHRYNLKACEDAIARLQLEEQDLAGAIALLGEKP
jgi:hypothetical protein